MKGHDPKRNCLLIAFVRGTEAGGSKGGGSCVNLGSWHTDLLTIVLSRAQFLSKSVSVIYSEGGGASATVVESLDEVRRRPHATPEPGRSLGPPLRHPTDRLAQSWVGLSSGHLNSPLECRTPMRLVMWARMGKGLARGA